MNPILASNVREANVVGQACGMLLAMNDGYPPTKDRIMQWVNDYEEMVRLRDEALAFRLMEISQ